MTRLELITTWLCKGTITTAKAEFRHNKAKFNIYDNLTLQNQY